MTRSLPTLLALVAALVVAGGLLAGRGWPDPDPGLRYVDLQRCLDGYTAAQTELVALNKFAADLGADLRKREAELKAEESELRLLDPASEEYAARAHALQTGQAQLQADADFERQRLQRRESDLLVRTYLQVQRAAAEVAAREGFGGVMTIPKDLGPELLRQPTVALEALQNRNLLWTNPSFEITDMVLEALNQG